MLALLDARDAGLLERLRAAPVLELESWEELEVRFIPEHLQPNGCSIAGAYIDSLQPPIIGIVEGSYARREAFTALHELGHHLQRTESVLVDDLPVQEDRGKELEEATADAFAAAVLLPPDLVSATIGSSTPTVRAVKELWAASPTASRAAVCVRVSEVLTSVGYVLLLDSSGKISFSKSVGTLPLRRGLDQSRSTIATAIRDSDAPVVNRRTTFEFARGQVTEEYYAQATDLGGYTVVIAVADGAPWEAISLSSTAAPSYRTWNECEHCGALTNVFEVEACSICGKPQCRDCGRCACPSRVSEQLCNECFVVKPAHLFSADGTPCSDCA